MVAKATSGTSRPAPRLTHHGIRNAAHTHGTASTSISRRRFNGRGSHTCIAVTASITESGVSKRAANIIATQWLIDQSSVSATTG